MKPDETILKPVGPIIYYDLPFEELTPVEGNIFEYLRDFDCVFTDNGRAAMRLVGEYLGSGEILMSDYSCLSVAFGFQSPLKIVNYPIKDDYSPDLEAIERLITKDTRLICVNQFCGRLLDPETVDGLLRLKEKYGVLLLEDATQSIMSSPRTFGDFCTSSLYKWFPCVSGGVLYSRTPLPAEIKNRKLRVRAPHKRAYAMVLKALQVKGILDRQDLADPMFDQFEDDNREEALLPIAGMPALDRFLLTCFNVENARRKRTDNAISVSRMIRYDMGIIQPVYDRLPDEADCLLCYPIRVSDKARRDALKAHLEDNGIYAPGYWHLEPPFGSYPESVALSEKVLCLPIDQRYNEEDMQRVADVINRWQEKNV